MSLLGVSCISTEGSIENGCLCNTGRAIGQSQPIGEYWQRAINRSSALYMGGQNYFHLPPNYLASGWVNGVCGWSARVAAMATAGN